MADADEMEGPLDSGFPGCSIGVFGRLPEEEPFTGKVNGNKLACVLRLNLEAVPVVDLAASLGNSVRTESHHALTVASFRATLVLVDAPARGSNRRLIPAAKSLNSRSTAPARLRFWWFSR